MITVNRELLESLNACEPCISWFTETYGSATFKSAKDVWVFIENMDWPKLRYVNWLLCRLLTPDQCVTYANNATDNAADAADWAYNGVAKAADWTTVWAAAEIAGTAEIDKIDKVAAITLRELIMFGVKLYFNEGI